MSPRYLILAAVAGVLAYAAGLAGPFVLDDHVNLAPLWRWLAGQQDFATTVFGNGSGPLSRPLAYLSFVANAALGGQAPLGFKAVNLALHLVNAGLVYLLLRRLLGVVGGSAPWARPASDQAVVVGGSPTEWAPTPAAGLALTVAALWLLHPQHVSSVLYVVQRMALLGALAQLIAVLIYLEGRQALGSDPRRARGLLFLAFPVAVGAGALAKETAALAPLLCLTLELTVLHSAAPGDAGARRMLALFFALFLGLPLLAGVATLAFVPSRFFDGYAGREFDLYGRLLTEPRVLLDYALAWFWPVDARLALYRDGYSASTGLLQPASTALAIMLWAGLALAAWLTRQRWSLFALGILWFLAGHALEGSLLPLELYFEHRNYLPSLGLLLAATGLLVPVLARLPTLGVQAGIVALALGLTVLTGVRAAQWRSLDRLFAAEAPPAGEISRRLQIDLAITAFGEGDVAGTEAALAVLDAGNRGDRASAQLYRSLFACDRDGQLTPAQRSALASAGPAVLTHNHLGALNLLATRAIEDRCAGIDSAGVSTLIETWAAGVHKVPRRGNARRLATLRLRLVEADVEPTR